MELRATYVRIVEHQTSVKRIGVIEEPNHRSFGEADFKYRKVFSVFDYGTIFPPVPLDNSTICLMGGFNFELLREAGVASHYLGLVDDNGRLVSAKQAVSEGIAPETMRVQFANRLMPTFAKGKWDYSGFKDGEVQCYVHPMEFIVRNALPEASSVWKRVARGEISMQGLGLPADFKQGDIIPEHLRPILDYSTKFEPEDRYVSAEQAKQLLGLTAKRFNHINSRNRRASKVMTEYAASRGFVREDGKDECVTGVMDGGEGELLGDVVCTWHEDRITYQGVAISKQVIRDKIRTVSPAWAAEIERAKKQAKEEGKKDFRTLINTAFPYISPSTPFFEAVNTLFQAATNHWVGVRVYQLYSGQKNGMRGDLERAIEEFQRVA